jgi:hypothetical protein
VPVTVGVRMVSKLPVENVGERLVLLFVEPLGNDYWMKPEDAFVVVGGGEVADSEFSIDSMPDHVIVWVNEGDPFAVKVFDQASGVELECGFQRPAGAFEPSAVVDFGDP